MWVAWFVLGLFMFCTNRWFPHLSNKTGYAHAFFGWSIIIMNMYAALNIIALNQIKTFGLHNILGLMMTIGLIFFGATGVLTMIAKKRLEWSTKKIMMIRKFHKLLAFLFWGLSLVVITSGITFFVWNNTEIPENY
jgi:hypothetical protein